MENDWIDPEKVEMVRLYGIGYSCPEVARITNSSKHTVLIKIKKTYHRLKYYLYGPNPSSYWWFGKLRDIRTDAIKIIHSYNEYTSNKPEYHKLIEKSLGISNDNNHDLTAYQAKKIYEELRSLSIMDQLPLP